MTTKTFGKGLYLLLVTVLAITVAWAVGQVPQPLRGALVLGLFAATAVGALVGLVLSHHRDLTAQRQQAGVRRPALRPAGGPRMPTRRPRVVAMASEQATRLTLR